MKQTRLNGVVLDVLEPGDPGYGVSVVAGNAGVHLKVSEKGAVSVYGLRRFPITFYADEWERLIEMQCAIRAFIASNEQSLSRKS